MKSLVSKLNGATAAGLAAALAAGCSSTTLATRPVTTHVVQVVGSGKKLGLVQDPVTAQYSLGYQSILIGLMTVPITTAMDTNGAVKYLVPDAVASYEIAGKAGFFGGAGSTYTVAVGPNAVGTLLGGQHPPINGALWTNLNINVTSLPLANSPVPYTTISTGSNILQAPIVIRP